MTSAKYIVVLTGFLGCSLLQAEEAKLEQGMVVPGITSQQLKSSLDKNFTAYLGDLLENKAAREEFVRQFYVFHALEQRAEEKLSPAEKEMVMVELELRRGEILRDAVIKHELDSRDLDIEALAQERYTTNKESYKTRRRIKIAQIFMATKPGQEAEVKQKMESILAQLEEDNQRHYEAAEAKKKAEEQKSDVKAEAETDAEKAVEVDLFAELAKEHSEGINASLGGFDSRWLLQPHNEVSDPVIKAAFSLLRRGEMTGVIDGKNGYHILRLMDYIPNRQQEFKEVKAKIVTAIKEELWVEKSKMLTEELQVPKDLPINDDLTLSIIKEVYSARDDSLKQEKE